MKWSLCVRALLMAVVLLVAGTGSAPSIAAQKAASGSALTRWHRAYAFLNAQTKPTEIDCGRLRGRTWDEVSRVSKPVRFYDFADPTAWRGHLVTRLNAVPRHTFETCSATVPTSVPYGRAIDAFLAPYGLIFFEMALPHPADLTPIEIAYAGQNERDPDIIYRDKPGLFGLRIALSPLTTSAFRPGTSKIVQPRSNAAAARYLRYSKPLLDWYGFSG